MSASTDNENPLDHCSNVDGDCVLLHGNQWMLWQKIQYYIHIIIQHKYFLFYSIWLQRDCWAELFEWSLVHTTCNIRTGRYEVGIIFESSMQYDEQKKRKRVRSVFKQRFPKTGVLTKKFCVDLHQNWQEAPLDNKCIGWHGFLAH